MVFVNIYNTFNAGNAAQSSFTFYHGLSGYYTCKIVGWSYADTSGGNLLIGVNINELRVPSNPYTYTFIKNATTSHYPQDLPIVSAQLNQYFTINIINILTGNAPTNFSGYTLYMECEEITPNNLISN